MKELNVYELVNSFRFFNENDSFVTTNNRYDRDSRMTFAEIKANKKTFESYYVADFSVMHMMENSICIAIKED